VASLAADNASSGEAGMLNRLPKVSLHDDPEVAKLVNANAIWSPADLVCYLARLA
jgi:hypothetical protein